MGLDLAAEPGPPSAFLWQYPQATAPHIQLVVPRLQDGEAGIIDYDGPFSAAGITHAARKLAGPQAPQVSPEDLSRIDAYIEKLFDALFDLLFIEDSTKCSQSNERSSWWRRLRGGKRAADENKLDAAARSGAAQLQEAVRQPN